ncbi:MAG: hypothetical protein QM767_18155 [Anaeromyxobacter sp.]
MKAIALCLTLAAQVLLAVLLHWMRSRGVGSLLRWDAVAFGAPLLGASAAYFLLFGGVARGGVFSWRAAGLGVVAVVLGMVVQGIGMTVAANLYGT